MGIKPSVATIGLLLLIALAAACGSAVRQSPAERPTSAEPLVWPQPPAQARIRFIRAVTRPADLDIKRSFWKRVLQAIRGKEDVRFVRPGAVAAHGDVIYVADPGAQTLWILNPKAHWFKRIREVGDDEPLISPVAVALGPNGRVYLADSYLTKVFVFSADGKLQRTIADAKLQRPVGLAYDAATDGLYVADSAAHRIWVFSNEGKSLRTIGEHGTARGQFNFPTHVALDREGTLHVTDALGFRIQRFARDGRFVDAFGHHGNASGDFAAPKGVAVDSEGHIYVVDALFDTVQIFDRAGRYLLNFGERGVNLGQFWLPAGLFIDAADRVYVADAYNQRIQIFQYLRGGGDD
ncbi:MAG: SMP-30/gluconolactonase/LRE family protein [Gammaproteobacteria bacterium]|nr:SMP-30/gluconolactonase/LRE family protein [Gammaproteobacteria bacterium]